MTALLNKAYWENRYQQGQTGWDAGQITIPLKAYVDQLTNKNLKILIPGAGNAHEARYLYHQGFTNIFVADIAVSPLQNFVANMPGFPKNNLLHDDFFNLSGTYELVLEQTFFCAIKPSLRPKYAEKMHSLLDNGGKVAGLLFNFPLTVEGPPFGGDKDEYLGYFEKYFQIKTLEPCYNSIKPREGRELFFIFEKRNS